MKNLISVKLALIIFLLCLILLLICMLNIGRKCPKDYYAKEYGKPKITKTNVVNNYLGISQILSDKNKIYILFDTHCVVSVFDISGDYLYTISVYSHENGKAEIAVDNDLLYIRDKYKNVYVFNGEKHLDLIPANFENDTVNNINFENKSDTVFLKNASIYHRDSNGNTIKIIHRPIWLVFSQKYISQPLLFALAALLGVVLFFPKNKVG